MRLFGHQNQDDDTLLALKEVSIEIADTDVVRLRQLADFFSRVAVLMEQTGKAFGHEHFSFFCRNSGIEVAPGEPDLIIARRVESESHM